jgi:replication factor C subunit 2/4
MTEGAQQALRRTMELYSNTTRFALACNQSSKIIEPIQSRCAILRFTKLSDTQVLKRLMEVVQIENIPYSEAGIEAIIFTADGDMRQALNNLQSTYAGSGFISPENVFKVCDQPHPLVITSIVESLSQGDFDGAHQKLEGLWKEGYAASDIITTIFRVVKNNNSLTEYLKLEFLKEIGNAHMKIVGGLNTFLQLSGLIARLYSLVVVTNQLQSSTLK